MSTSFYEYIAATYGFTPAQALVFPYLCHGHIYEDIGKQIGVNTRGVQRHASHIMHKLGVQRRSQLKGWVAVNFQLYNAQSDSAYHELQALKAAVRHYFASDCKNVLAAEDHLLKLVADG